MVSRALCAILPLLALAQDPLDRALADGYNYNRCDLKGPENWPGDCIAQEQGVKTHGTPIDLCGAVEYPDGGLPTIVPDYGTPVGMTISSDGSSLKVTVSSNRPSLTVGNLSQIVGRSDEDVDYTWNLEQMHIHWGREGKTDEGSEHYLQGSAYAAEAHFVHYNSKYASFGDAVAAGLDGSDEALLVVGFFLKPGSSEAEIFTEMAKMAPKITKNEQSIGNVDLSDLMGGLGDETYYSYAGGLTTPKCYEIVTWIVVQDVKTITSASLQALWNLRTTPGGVNSEKISKYGNYRPLQSIAGRELYISSGTSAACKVVTEPVFDCTVTTSAGLSLIPSMLLPFAILFGFFANMH